MLQIQFAYLQLLCAMYKCATSNIKSSLPLSHPWTNIRLITACSLCDLIILRIIKLIHTSAVDCTLLCVAICVFSELELYARVLVKFAIHFVEHICVLHRALDRNRQVFLTSAWSQRKLNLVAWHSADAGNDVNDVGRKVTLLQPDYLHLKVARIIYQLFENSRRLFFFVSAISRDDIAIDDRRGPADETANIRVTVTGGASAFGQAPQNGMLASERRHESTSVP